MTHKPLVLCFDFESYYDTEYSLSKMCPPNYILDARWETIGCSFKEDSAPAHFVDGPDVGAYISQFDPSVTTTIAFNALFDNCVLAWHYGFVPKRMLCTMRMAAALRGHLLASVSLAKVGAFMGVGVKGTTIENARGKRRADLMADPGLWRAYQAYANNDNEMNHDIFYKLAPEFPSSERRVMDAVLRCAVAPSFVVNTVMLDQHLIDLHKDKQELLIAAGCERSATPELQEVACEAFSKELRSNPKFEALLQSMGVDIEYKHSVTNPAMMIPAFAKTDGFMSDLQEHADPVVAALANARLGLRSTIEESRGLRIQAIAALPWENHYRDGNGTFWSQKSLPIPLKYSGAHTHRLSGDWLLNPQNLPAGRGTNKSKLRLALEAPPGSKVVVADKSQIECRLNGWICGQHDLLEIFRQLGDPYSVLASAIFGFKVDKKVHLTERFIGKSGVLGLGFGCGAEKFYNMVVRAARILGLNIPELLKVWTPELAQHAVDIYRGSNGAIVSTWRVLDGLLQTAWLPGGTPSRFGPCIIGPGYVKGPGGLVMNYARPREEDGELWYDYGRRTYKMYGSKFLENIVQFIARIDTMNDSLRIAERGFHYALQSHDELVWIVPDEKVAECQAVALEEMRRPPSWAMSVPLNAECSFGQSYGEAK